MKEKGDCFGQLFGRDFPSSVGSVALMVFSVTLPLCSRKLAPVLGRGGWLLEAHAERSRTLRIASSSFSLPASLKTWCSHVSACGCW